MTRRHLLGSNGRKSHPTAARRGGFSQISSLDMLTCGLGAFLALCIISMGISSPRRGLVPGVILTFEVDSPSKALIGVRAVTSGQIAWAGGGSGDQSIRFNPSREGAGSIVVVLTGEYQPHDRLYVFVSDLGPDTPKWLDGSSNVKVKVNVALNGAAQKQLELSQSRMSDSIHLDGIRQATSLKWVNDDSP